MNSIAFIESNTTGTGEKFILAAKKLGLNIIFLTTMPEKYGFLRNLLLHPVMIDTKDVNQIYAYLKDIPNLVGITSSSESFIYNAAFVAKKCGLPHPNPDAIANCRDKYKFSQLLKEAGLPVIATTKDHGSQFDFPVVVKPNPGTGSIGVKLCHTSDELGEHIKSLHSSEALIQEYIIGEEYSAEVIAINGQYHYLGITKKHLGPEPYFVEYGHDFPANLANELYNDVIEVLSNALKKVGFNFGPAHIEFRIAREKIYIIEINPRLAGGMIPILIEQSTGIKLIENLIKMFIGKPVGFQAKSNFATKIAFMIPNQEGVLKSVKNIQDARYQGNIIDVSLYKNIGDRITLKGDFSDRIGFIIAKAKTAETCLKAIQKAMSIPKFLIEDESSDHGRARLAEPLDPRIRQILEQNVFFNLDDLQLLSEINFAHVIMLKKCKIISDAKAKALLDAMRELEKENFASVRLLNNCSIGFYLAYEQRLIEKLGVEIAGVIHSGRSRNDINATIQRLKTREVFREIYKTLWALRSDLVQAATRNLHVAMPIYSQYQAAMPATYAYYLLAVEEAFALAQVDLKQQVGNINTSTLGGSSGAGTTYPIDPNVTAKQLGFSVAMHNALTVVASRDLELRMLSIGSILGVTISRMAQDFQLWVTREFAFFDLPDRLCGISSAMPQKKNPYLLEKIKGKSIRISGILTAAMATMHKVSFSNSVEVGTEALTGYLESFSELIKAMKLLSLVIQGATPIQKNLDLSNKEGLTIATVLAENIAQSQDISCREAHSLIANEINRAIEDDLDPLERILSLDHNVTSDSADWHKELEYGNGPGEKSILRMFQKAENRLKSDGDFLEAITKNWDKLYR